MARLCTLVVVLGVVCGCGNAARPGGGVVPWVNRPLPLYVRPEPPLVSYSTSAPPCRAVQLRVTQGRNGVGLGNRLEELVFTNVGPRSCLLRGYPAVSAETAAGARLQLSPRHGTYFGTLAPADLRPGGHVFLDFGTSDCDCTCEGASPGVRYRNLVFTLPGGRRMRAEGVSLTKDCFLDMSSFGLPLRRTQPHARPGTVGVLRAGLHLPAAVRAGTTLRYAVTLTNPSRTKVRLEPCPGYTEALYALRSLALNCDYVQAIGPHAKVRFEMLIAVPRPARPGTAKLGWYLNTPTARAAVGVIRITAG